MPKHITRLIEKIFGKDGNNNQNDSNEDSVSLDITDGDDGLCSTPADLTTLRQKAQDSKTEREERRAIKRKAKEEHAEIKRKRIEKRKEEIEEEYRSAIEPYILRCIARGNGQHEKRIHINWLKFEKFGYLPVTYDITTGYESVPKEWYTIYSNVAEDICDGLRYDGIIDNYNYIGGTIDSIDIKSTVVTLCL
jgi:hypothetical protein